jgi:UDP-glucose 4-epimerase
MRLLVTGGTGFIGGAWLNRFGRDHEVTSLGRARPNGVQRHIPCDFKVPGELIRLLEADDALGPIDAIIHLAVSPHHRDFPSRATELFQVNVATTAALLDFAWRAGVKHFVLGSTGSVYHNSGHEVLSESIALAPNRFFPATKLAAEQMSHEYQSFFNVTTLRFFTPYGPQQRERLVPDIIGRVKSGTAVSLPPEGDGLTFAMTYIDDIVAILEATLENPWNEVVNIAHNRIVSIKSLADEIGLQVGREPIFQRHVDAPTYALVPSLEKLRQRFDVSNMVDLEPGLAATLALSTQITF